MSETNYGGAFDGVEDSGSSLDDFLEEPERARGKHSVFNWRKRRDGVASVFLHPRASIYPIWSTNWPRIVEYEKDDEKHVKVFGSRWVSHESPDVLRKQFFRDKETGLRELPPRVCPMSKFLEWVYLEIRSGRLNWTAPLFVFDRDDLTDEPFTIHAGGATGMFQSRKLTTEQKAQLRKSKSIILKETYRENLAPRESFLFQIVDADDIGAGVQTAIEGSALGRAFREAIKDERRKAERKGDPDFGDPRKRHYGFEWRYDKDADFSERYRVIALTDEIAPPEVEALFESDPPSVANFTAFGDVEALRTEMEAFCVLDGVPWDLFFADLIGTKGPAAAPKKMNDAKIREVAGLAMKEAGRKIAEDAATVAAGGDMSPSDASSLEFDCDACGVAGNDPATCANCGATYDAKGRASRPCSSCKTPIELPEGAFDAIKSQKVICGSCGLVHPIETWTPDKPADAPARRRRGAAA